MSRRLTNIDEIYGMRIIPDEDGYFDGIVIWGNQIVEFFYMCVSKMVGTAENYHEDSSIEISFEECSEHEKSGKEFAEFLYSKAKELSKGNEEIAIIDRLAAFIMLLDAEDRRFQEAQQKLKQIKK